MELGYLLANVYMLSCFNNILLVLLLLQLQHLYFLSDHSVLSLSL